MRDDSRRLYPTRYPASNRISFSQQALWFALALAAGPGIAAPLDTARETHVDTQQQGARSQQQVEKIDDATQAMLNEYRSGLRELDNLKVYHQQLGREVKSQEAERTAMEKQLADIEVTQRSITPLMLRMLEVLTQFVTLDTPFLAQERKKRVEELKALMDRSDVTLAEKYRRLMEAYQIETEYTRSIEAYRGDLKKGEQARAVDFLRFGRLGLYYLTLDHREAGYWDQEAHRWVVLASQYRNDIERGLRIARKQAAPDLLKMPITAPEVGS